MHHEITQKLWEMFPQDDKGDFYSILMYLKHLDHFLYKGIQNMGLPVGKAPDGELHPEVDEVLSFVLQSVAEGSSSRDTSIYHGKVMQLKEALQFVRQKQDLSLEPPETVVPYKQARNVILQNPESLAIGECPCRAVAEKPCLPPDQLDVCLFVGDPGASFIAQFNPKFRKVTQDEAAKILEDCHEKGFVHCAYFKKDFARRFVAICNCCSCCCLGMKAWNTFGEAVPILAPSGYVAEIGEDCDGCGDCLNSCGFSALDLDNEEDVAVVNLEKCMGCGVCVDKCSKEGITLRLEPSKGEPLDLGALMEQA